MAEQELAQQVVDMRDRGVSWNQIGLDLQLVPNAADPANYKSRAAQARKLYKQVKGALPPSSRSQAAPRTPKAGDGEAAPKRQRKARGGGVPARPEFAPKGEASAKLAEMSDEEVIEHLKGRVVKWTIAIGKNGDLLQQGDDYTDAEYYEQECIVGRTNPRIIEAPLGRAITFNEAEAGSRSIYLHRIHTVA